MKNQHDIVLDENKAMNLAFEKIYKRVRTHVQRLVSNIDSEKGLVTDSYYNFTLANQINADVLKILQEDNYFEFLKENYENDKELINKLKLSQPSNDNYVQLNILQKDNSILTKLRRTNLTQLNLYSTKYRDDLQALMLENLLIGGSKEKLLSRINSITSQRFKGYTETYLTTSKQQLFQQVQDLSAENYEGDLFWIYEGPHDKENRPECSYGTSNRFFTNAEKIKFIDEYSPRWNCRHTFMQITEDFYNDNTK